LSVGVQLAEVAPAVAERCYAVADGVLQSKTVAEMPACFLDRVLLAACLHHQDAATLLAALRTPFAETTSVPEHSALYALTNLLAPGDAADCLNGIPANTQGVIVAGAVTYLLQRAPKHAETLLPLLQSGAVAYAPDACDETLLAELGRSYPAAAAAVAMACGRRAFLPYAYRYQPAETALAFYRQCNAQPSIPPADMRLPDQPGRVDFAAMPVYMQAEIAARAYALDRQLGGELFAKLRETYRTSPANPLAYAYCSASIDPTTARVVIEQTYAGAKTAGADANWPAVDYPLAMATIDPDRALQLLMEMQQMGMQADARQQAARNLIHYLLATPQERLTPTENLKTE
jgi:hypothetical protein